MGGKRLLDVFYAVPSQISTPHRLVLRKEARSTQNVVGEEGECTGRTSMCCWEEARAGEQGKMNDVLWRRR
jgi:hypothetical protein